MSEPATPAPSRPTLTMAAIGPDGEYIPSFLSSPFAKWLLTTVASTLTTLQVCIPEAVFAAHPHARLAMQITIALLAPLAMKSHAGAMPKQAAP